MKNRMRKENEVLMRQQGKAFLRDTEDDYERGSNSIGSCGWVLFLISWLLVMITLPFSLCVLLKVRILLPET